MFVALLMAVVATGAWAISGSPAAISLNLGADVVALVYGTAIYESSRRYKEQQRKVRTLARHPMSVSRTPWPEMDEEPVAL